MTFKTNALTGILKSKQKHEPKLCPYPSLNLGKKESVRGFAALFSGNRSESVQQSCFLSVGPIKLLDVTLA